MDCYASTRSNEGEDGDGRSRESSVASHANESSLTIRNFILLNLPSAAVTLDSPKNTKMNPQNNFNMVMKLKRTLLNRMRYNQLRSAFKSETLYLLHEYSFSDFNAFFPIDKIGDLIIFNFPCLH